MFGGTWVLGDVWPLEKDILSSFDRYDCNIEEN